MFRNFPEASNLSSQQFNLQDIRVHYNMQQLLCVFYALNIAAAAIIPFEIPVDMRSALS